MLQWCVQMAGYSSAWNWRIRRTRSGARLPIWLLSLLLLALVECVHVPERRPLPKEHVDDAEVLGIPRARFWGDQPPPWEHAWFGPAQSETSEPPVGIHGRRHSYLAISGGGENGAFAAGFLVGWTKAGDRPEFTTVTGISAGALLAPFAFLGADYDSMLTEVSARLTADQVYERRRLLQGLRSDALASTEPLRRLIEAHVDQEVMEKIAEEYRKGRMLNIGTTNLDAKRPVIWRIGAIANSGHPRALDLIRTILLASAAVPGAFPPVLIEVQVGQRRFDELHVDGGATSQVFLYPVRLDWNRMAEKLDVRGRPAVYVIYNSRIEPLYEHVDNEFVPITGHSIESLVRGQGVGDLYQIYLATCRDGLSFHLAHIPSDFTDTATAWFDSEYMQKVFDAGFESAKDGYSWRRTPPQLGEPPMYCR